MAALIPIVMYGWIPVVLYLFVRFPTQRAVIVSLIVAWQFLPQVSLSLPGLPPYNKMSAACYGVLLGTLVYDTTRFSSLKPGWIDVPIVICCLCPIASQVTNGGSPLSPTLNQIVAWGMPFLLGRLYLNSLDGLRQLAIGIFAGGLAYIPFTMIEGVRGPILHQMVYGVNAFEDWGQARRMGGWRPVVFMQHGLMVGLWMMAAALVGFWLWQTGVLKKFQGRNMKTLVIVLIIAFFLCRSTGAYSLFAMSLVVLFSAKIFKTSLPLLLIIGYIIFYLYLAASGQFSSEEVISFISQIFGEERAASLGFRFQNEEILGNKARLRFLFGWGDSGGNRVYNEYGDDVSVTDSLWIIAFGVNGVVGLTSLFSSLLLPVIAFCFKYPARTWSNPKVAPAAVLGVALTMYAFDCVLNAMTNPIFTLIAGGIAGVILKDTESLKPKKTSSPLPRRSFSPQKSRMSTTHH
ncbi:MAG: O-antigen ligase domain-containing protein [Oscillatoriales cyanobacterium]|uniref:O-antigen ligase domain-containing protein n=1 Tax=Microcoleus anatoxicus PTRS2 TaxID=2705321 RepID=A0ABU8YHB1_9CYAN|nr:MAG: O-antigen ligase domain-containing protein [Oscillatoriales cyanobacterium]TAD98215.1 MAG: O-antigen ligase domain-containing protein [Oscillatoriales cyanobacterium]TAE05680.1 MAG: O-antigen ligase domain-containing protein [Oscillatoriales cyanobacterium]TAF04752.1 MAG: O-antigen ligase domain-containing protein [Oscillatoriales cyanobacterium]TAF47891.1 MAG: O-antigen ligase domain-containing protein [Oscillatoriales cyanobacterium]